MPVAGILALVGVALTLAEQGINTFGRLKTMFDQAEAEGWGDDEWRAAAMELRQTSDEMNAEVEARLDRIIAGTEV